jgi:hypothetical protein
MTANNNTNNTNNGSATANSQQQQQQQEIGHSLAEAEAALRDTEFTNVEELLVALQASEENMFTLYHETQSKHEEVEKMELENKHLEYQVQIQMKQLHGLEGNQEQVKQELEKNIEHLQHSITKYDADYTHNNEILKACSDSLMNLLRNIAIDEAAIDQQLLSAGLNDRNVDDFLGLIEQRIDELIQMFKAANKQSIKRDDFVQPTSYSNSSSGGGGGGNNNNNNNNNTKFQIPVPPSLNDPNDEEEDMDDPTGKIQPLNVGALRDIIHKKVARMTMPPVIRRLDKNQMMMMGQTNSSSRQLSTSSLRSSNSVKSNQQIGLGQD